jgi:hypothetical protein
VLLRETCISQLIEAMRGECRRIGAAVPLVLYKSGFVLLCLMEGRCFGR